MKAAHTPEYYISHVEFKGILTVREVDYTSKDPNTFRPFYDIRLCVYYDYLYIHYISCG